MARRTASKAWGNHSESKAKSKKKAQFQYKKSRRQKSLGRIQSREDSREERL
jgi:hypothetical protein